MVRAKRDDVIIVTKPGSDFGERCVVRRVTGTYITASTSTNYLFYLKHDEYTIENNPVKAKVGDTIIVTLSGLKSTGELCIVVDPLPCSSSIVNMSHSIWVKRKDGTEGEFWLLHSSYEIVEENKIEIAKPGDTILVTDKTSLVLFSREFVVVEHKYNLHGIDDSTGVWINKAKDITAFVWVSHANYKVTRRANSSSSASTSVSCPDCNDTGIIELFTSTVKCKCRE